MRIDVHVERLVLSGVPVGPDQVGELRLRLEAELARVLAGPDRAGLVTSGGATPVLRAAMAAPPASDARGWGEGIAGAVKQVVIP